MEVTSREAAGAAPSRSSGRSRDLAFSVLRGATLAAWVAIALAGWLGPGLASSLVILGLAAAYLALLYPLGRSLLMGGQPSSRRFYLVVFALDLVCLGGLLAVTGGVASPFTRALYLWVALMALLLGSRAGVVGGALALAILAGLWLGHGTPGSSWPLVMDGVALLGLGLVVGALADRQRVGAAELAAALDRLAEANRHLAAEQSRLLQTEKLSSIGLLAAGVAHEVNNPLSGISGCIRALHDGAVPAERREEYFETVRDGLDRIGAAVRGLLDYARLRPPAPSELDLAEVAGACLRLVGPALRKKGVATEVRVPPGLASVRADRSQLMLALVNVLLNAVYASPEGGTIVVEVERAGTLLGIRVIDRGDGIRDPDLARVFDPFFTTKPEGEGTGLGLSVTLGIVRNHGGDVTIETSPGKGTGVTIWLPATAEVSAHA